MNNPKASRRSRGRSQNRNSNARRGADFNHKEVRPRGNPIQLVDKYTSLARDAVSSGDRVLAENYFQHADHYQRLINEKNAKRQGDDKGGEMNGRRRGRQQNRQASNDAGGASKDDAAASAQADAESAPEEKPRPRRRRRGGDSADEKKSGQSSETVSA